MYASICCPSSRPSSEVWLHHVINLVNFFRSKEKSPFLSLDLDLSSSKSFSHERQRLSPRYLLLHHYRRLSPNLFLLKLTTTSRWNFHFLLHYLAGIAVEKLVVPLRCDEDIQADPVQEEDEPDQEEDEPGQTMFKMPFVPNKPLTRAAARSLHQRFNGVIRKIMEQLEHSEGTRTTVGQTLKPLANKPPDKDLMTNPALKGPQDHSSNSGHPLALKLHSEDHLSAGDQVPRLTETPGNRSSHQKAIDEHLAATFGQLSLRPTKAPKDHPGDSFRLEEAYEHKESSQDTSFWVESLLGQFNPKPSPLRQVTLSCLTLGEPI